MPGELSSIISLGSTYHRYSQFRHLGIQHFKQFSSENSHSRIYNDILYAVLELSVRVVLDVHVEEDGLLGLGAVQHAVERARMTQRFRPRARPIRLSFGLALRTVGRSALYW